MTFLSLGLTPDLARAALTLGLSVPTPVQAETIPAVLRGADVLARAPTGSGKTAAYALPVLQRLQAASAAAAARAPRRVRALVLVPTRELAAQVGEVLRQLGTASDDGTAGTPGTGRPLRVAVLFGGVSVNPQMMGLRGGADVVVATPGRLLDLMHRNALRLSHVETLVIDEADRLLDLGFANELASVLAILPRRRQNLFFSATFPAAVRALAEPLLHAPERITITAPAPAAPGANRAAGPADAARAVAGALVQRAIAVDPARRTMLLKHLIQSSGWTRTLVFVATRYAADHVAWKLYKSGLYATPLHGDMSQGQRTEVLQQFKNGQWDVVVTTDLAARGIDIPDLPVVVNFDLPRSPVDHVHRIGRTARASASGLAVSFVSTDTEAHWRLIEKRQGLTLTLEQVPGFEPQPPAAGPAAGVARDAPAPARPAGGIKGKRPSKKDKLRAAARADTRPQDT
jgi:ATP-dependent RNA helicase RhlE